MGLQFYSFALFVFLLLCLFAYLCKQLFSSGKKSLIMLEEKEKKLLALYSTLEETMDDFNASVAQSQKENEYKLREIRDLAKSLKQGQAPPASPTAAVPVALDEDKPKRNNRTRKKKDETEAPAETEKSNANDATGRATRILQLAEQGYDRVRIAKELSVTLSEIDLVLGFAKQKD